MEIMGKGKPENPGKGKGKVKLGICQLQGVDEGNPHYKFKALPEPAALKMIATGKAVAAGSQAECDALTEAIVQEDE